MATEMSMPALFAHHSRLTWNKHSALLKNSGAMVIGSGTAAVLGFAYWWLAARSFSPDAIGRAAANFSLMQLVGMIGGAGIGTLLTGEIILWPGRERGLVSAASLMGLGISLLVGGAVILVSQFFLEQSLMWDIALLIGCALTGLSNVVDAAFVGMLTSHMRLLRQVLFSVIKLLFIGYAVYWFINESALLFSWIAAIIFSLVLVEMVVSRSGRSLLHKPDFILLKHLQLKTVDHYLLDFAVQVPIITLPYFVTVMLSPTSNAVFNVLWMVMTVSFLVPAALATVLFPAVRADPHQYHDKMTLSLVASLLFSVLFGLFIYFTSHTLLSLFNPEYGRIAGTDLQYLGFGLIGTTVKFHVCAAARLHDYMRKASGWLAVAAAFEIACVAVGCWLDGLEGLSVGWTLAMFVEGVVMLLMANPCAASRHPTLSNG